MLEYNSGGACQGTKILIYPKIFLKESYHFIKIFLTTLFVSIINETLNKVCKGVRSLGFIFAILIG